MVVREAVSEVWLRLTRQRTARLEVPAGSPIIGGHSLTVPAYLEASVVFAGRSRRTLIAVFRGQNPV